MSTLDILHEQLRLAKLTRDCEPFRLNNWLRVKALCEKVQSEGWRVLLISDQLLAGDWKTFDRFVIQGDDRLLYRQGKTDDKFRIKGEVAAVMNIRPEQSRDFSFSRLKSAVEVVQGQEKKSRIVNKLMNDIKPVCQEISPSDLVFKSNEIVTIHGAPGTGKSSKLVDITRKFYGNRKILYFAPNHDQVNCFAKKLKEKNMSFVIMSDESRVDDEVVKFHRVNVEPVNDKYKNTLPEKSTLILATINKPLKYLSRAEVEIVLVDEASRITLLEAITAILPIKTLKLLVLGGDSKQICVEGPKFKPITNILDFANKRADKQMRVMVSYRLCVKTAEMISTIFYGKKLSSARNEAGILRVTVIDHKHQCDHRLKCDFGCFRRHTKESR